MKRREFFGKALKWVSLGSFLAPLLGLRHRPQLLGVSCDTQFLLGPGGSAELPPMPFEGQQVQVFSTGGWGACPAVLRGNGHAIQGRLEDLELDVDSSFSLIFRGSGRGWEVS